ncbi:MAG TPA: FecR family protein, partial [Smithellaceae bacterium]|nr:FecR family protein [Smithellaceae bacterium]
MKLKLTSFIVMMLILSVWAVAVQAAPAGKVTNLEGKVDITSTGQLLKPLLIGDTVHVGDIIRTKSASKCEITWIDGSIARLAPNTRLQVTTFNLHQNSRKTILSLFRGKIQNVVTASARLFSGKGDSQYEVHTPTSVCGVRGTTFFNSYENGLAGSLFTEGSGYMYSKGRPGDRRNITPGIFMTVSNANIPPRARSATQGETNKFFQDTNLAEKKKEAKKSEEGKGPAAAGGGSSGKNGASTQTQEGDTSSEPPPASGTQLGGAPVGTELGGDAGKIVSTHAPEPVVEPTPVVPVTPVVTTFPSVLMETTTVSPTKDTTAIFTLSSDSKTQVTFEYNLNNTGWQKIAGNALTLADSSFAAGNNHILFRAKDANGNVTKAENYAQKLWAFYNLNVTTDVVDPTKANAATFNLVSNTTDVKYEYQLNNSGTWIPVEGNMLRILAVLGKNILQIRAFDQYGNVSRPVDYNQNVWNVSDMAQNVTVGGVQGVLSGVFPAINFNASADTGIFISYLNGAEATLFDGSAYEGYLAGIPGSWRGLFTALYKNGSTIGILSSSNLNDAAFAGGMVNAVGTVSRTEVGTTSDTAT